MFVATPAMAITCGDSDECNDKSTAAQKCTDLGYSLNEVENCEHYVKCPFNTKYMKCVDYTTPEKACDELGYKTEDVKGCEEYQHCPYNENYKICVKYPKVSCQSLGFTQTTPCGSNQKQLTCTDSDGSVKYQCLDEKSAENCKSKGFKENSDNIWGCDKFVYCQEGGKTYKLCSEGHTLTSYDTDLCSPVCQEGEDSEYSNCADDEGYLDCLSDEVIVHSSVFNKSNGTYDCHEECDWDSNLEKDVCKDVCYSGACYTPVSVTSKGVSKSLDEDCLCTHCAYYNDSGDQIEDPNEYYCDCFAEVPSSGTATTDVCKSQGLYANMDGTFTPTKQGNSFGKVYFVSHYKSHFFFDSGFYFNDERCDEGCYAKVVALNSTTVTLKKDNDREDKCLANVAKVTEDKYCLEHNMSLSRDCRIITKNTGSNVVTNMLKINPDSEKKFAHDYNYEIYSWLGNSLGYLTNYNPGFGGGHWYVPTILETKKSGVGGDVTSSAECETGQFFATSQDDSNTGNFSLTNSGIIYPHLIIYSDGCPVQHSYETLNAAKWPPQN